MDLAHASGGGGADGTADEPGPLLLSVGLARRRHDPGEDVGVGSHVPDGGGGGGKGGGSDGGGDGGVEGGGVRGA